MKEMKTTAQVLVDCLEAEGVDVMFGIPGEETLDLMFAIRDSKIRFIPAVRSRYWWLVSCIRSVPTWPVMATSGAPSR